MGIVLSGVRQHYPTVQHICHSVVTTRSINWVVRECATSRAANRFVLNFAVAVPSRRHGRKCLMFTQRSPFVLVAFFVAVMASEREWMPTASAQVPTGSDHVLVEDLLQRVQSLENELRDVRRQQIPVNDRLPTASFDFASGQYATAETDGLYDPSQKVSLAKDGCGGKCCDCCGGFYSCQCPLTPAPCIECPHVSTLSPYFNVRFFGALKLDMLFSEARTIALGTPFFLGTRPTVGFDQNVVSIHARQSTLGAAFTGPQFCGFQSGGLVVAMFFNDSVIEDRYGLLPLQAYGELKNNDWRFAAGLQFDVFSPRAPTVLPFSVLGASGNSGNSFRGQLRLERFLHPSDDCQWTLQFALSEPIGSTIDSAFRISEDNGWPNVEGRIALGIGQPEQVGLEAYRPFEIGVSGVVGQIRTSEPLLARQVVADVWGASVDCRWKITRCWGVAGEVYTGQALGTYNGAALQTVNLDLATPALSTLEGIRSTGGWFETFLYLTPCLHTHVGYGVDDPVDSDVGISQRTLNSTIFANLIWDLNQTFRIGFEFTWRETNRRSIPMVDFDNEGAGFHTQFQWAF
jgi:hypothetical protein